MVVGVLLACSAAAAFGAGSTLQHHAASAVPRAHASTATGLVLTLVRRPGWLLGILISGAAFVLHIAALRHASLTLTQAIVVSNIVFAVLVRAALQRSVPPRRELAWVIATCAGLSLFLGMVETHIALQAIRSPAAEVFAISGVAATVILVGGAARTHTARRRGFLLASAAGVLYGLSAGLIKLVVIQATSGMMAVLRHWSSWAVLVVGPNALLLSQRAYHAARLSITIPILNIADVLVAIAFGTTVFGERIFGSPAHLLGGLLGLLVMGVGVWQLAGLEEEITLQQTHATSASGTSPPSGWL